VAQGQKWERRRVTVLRDDVARVDMEIDEDGDVAVMTLFREGNRWLQAEAAPTTAPPLALLAGLLKLGVLGLAAEDVAGIQAMAAGMNGTSPQGLEALTVALTTAVELARDPGWTRG
jgi:hypothetical protein